MCARMHRMYVPPQARAASPSCCASAQCARPPRAPAAERGGAAAAGAWRTTTPGYVRLASSCAGESGTCLRLSWLRGRTSDEDLDHLMAPLEEGKTRCQEGKRGLREDPRA